MVAARVALLTPFALPTLRGNAITVGRIARGLDARGVAVRVFDLSADPPRRLEAALRAYAPTLVHAFHAYRSGPLALRAARRAGVPLVVTVTGTDVNHDIGDPARARVVSGVLSGATAVTVFHESMAERIRAALPGVACRIAVVPQSVAFDVDATEAPAGAPAHDDGRPPGPVVLFPGGIRPVKNPRFSLRPLERLRERHPTLALVYAGPVLDAEEGRALAEALATRPWARHLGEVPHVRMRALYLASDVVLNCSTSEGGMANSVLEALELGRAVLASAIEGNRSLVQEGVTGLLYASEEEFGRQAARLLADESLRRRLGEAGRRLVRSAFAPERELEGYERVYAQVGGTARRPGA